MENINIYYSVYKTRLGDIYLGFQKYELISLSFNDFDKFKKKIIGYFSGSNIVIKYVSLQNSLKSEFDRYFNGNPVNWEIPLKLYGTSFQKRVWNELMNIPYGEIITYGDLAKILGDKNKARAVGNANSKNPVPIIIPCHRVVAANGKLGGFSAGIHWKKYILNIENVKWSNHYE